MRRQDQWLEFADRIGEPRALVVASFVYLNLRRPPWWVAKSVGAPLALVERIAREGRPLMRQPRSEAEWPLARVCAYCGTALDLTQDHQHPRSRGGSDAAENRVWACRSCNGSKGARTPEEWLG